jgi:uncharacterized protein (DUF952 family)
MDLIYRIVPASLWRKAQDKGRFDGAPVDIADGYIHFSTADQAEATAAKYFSGKDDLLLIAVDAKRLGDGVPYPHVYFALPLDAVVFAKSLPLLPDGKHDFTGLLG